MGRDLKTWPLEYEAGVLSIRSDVQFVTVKAQAYFIPATYKCLELHAATIISTLNADGRFFPSAAKIPPTPPMKSRQVLLFMNADVENHFVHEFDHDKLFCP
jgi:hypothetical protein